MAWDLEIVYSGLCLFYLPKDFDPDSDDVKKRPQVLLVDTKHRQAKSEHHHVHQHAPLLSFDLHDLDDQSVNPDNLLPRYVFSANERADHLVQVSLEGKQIGLELSEVDRVKPRFELKLVRGDTTSRKPGNQQQQRFLHWLASIKNTHEHIQRIKPSCLTAPPGAGCPVTARMPLRNGQFGSHRLGKLEDDFSVWEFYPADRAKYPIVQALADQASLRLTGLEDVVTLRLSSQDPSENFYLKFPSELDRRRVRLGISNLPATPETPASELLLHFRAFYQLVDWGNHPEPDWDDLPAPRPWTPQVFLGSSGAGLLCPCPECD